MSLTLEQFARTVANLYREHGDDCVVTLGDWQPSPIDRRPLFHGTIRVTVGDFRRWAGQSELGASPDRPSGADVKPLPRVDR